MLPPLEALAKWLRSKGGDTDMGSFKVIWSSLQIVGSIKGSTGVGWPQPFATFASWCATIHRYRHQC